MKLSVLIENTKKNDNFVCEHGISLFLQLDNENILFDTGSTGAFIMNAKTMGVDINSVDACVISHGHDDHGGGINTFFENNSKAKVYLHEGALTPHYSKKSKNNIVSISLDKNLLNNDRVVIVKNDTKLYEDVDIIGDIKIQHELPLTNNNLYKKVNNNYVLDDFKHEQDLVVKINDDYVLVVGCGHNGIKNILDHFYYKYKKMPKYVIGGFHLSSRTQRCESDEYVADLAHFLLDTNATYYTCHCTGLKAYETLKNIMKNKISYISSGDEIILK